MGVHLSKNWGKKYSIFDENLFLVFTKIWGKKVFHLHFFVVFTKFPNLNIIAVGFIPPMMKIKQNWGKIANYPPQCSTKIGTTGSSIGEKLIIPSKTSTAGRGFITAGKTIKHTLMDFTEVEETLWRCDELEIKL